MQRGMHDCYRVAALCQGKNLNSDLYLPHSVNYSLAVKVAGKFVSVETQVNVEYKFSPVARYCHTF